MKVERLVDVEAHDHSANQVDLKLHNGDIIVYRNRGNFILHLRLFQLDIQILSLLRQFFLLQNECLGLFLIGGLGFHQL